MNVRPTEKGKSKRALPTIKLLEMTSSREEETHGRNNEGEWCM
jgi:hypothetical protein